MVASLLYSFASARTLDTIKILPKIISLKEETVPLKRGKEVGSSDEGEIGLKAIKKKATQAFRSNHSCLG